MTSNVDATDTEDDTDTSDRNYVKRLEAENTRLRARLESRVTYRRSAGLFLGAAAVILGATLLFPTAQDVLLALAGTAVFGAILLVTLTPEPLVPAVVAGAVSDSKSRNLFEISRALGIDGHVTYLPMSSGEIGMYVSAAAYESVPTIADSDTAATINDESDTYGLLLEPTGHHLLAILDERTDGLLDDVETTLPMLFEAATDVFDLAQTLETVSADESVVSGGNHVTVRIVGTQFGDATDLDHPVPSLVGVGLAKVIDEPVETHATTTDEGDALVTFGWEDGPSVDL